MITTVLLFGVASGGFAGWASENIATDAAIGRLNHAGFKSRGHCTGFVTRGGLVITAAHCLPKIRTDTVHILLGYETGQLEQHIQTPATSYRVMKGQDIATLCNIPSHPRGLHVTNTPLKINRRVVVQGYGAPRVHTLQKTICTVQSLVQDNLVRLDCPLPPGTSGAPVTLVDSRDVIGVVSASSATRSLAYLLSSEGTARFCQ